MTLVLRCDDGVAIDLGADRWHAVATTAEEALLRTLDGPVLDVGCGPGRLAVALGEQGIVALGVDASEAAAALARARGATVVVRSIFDRMPCEGRWRTALLADGNIGIGGEPEDLLRRLSQILAPGGEIVVEVDPDASGVIRHRAHLDLDGATSAWFPWATVGLDAVATLADAAGLRWSGLDEVEGRPFARFTTSEADSRSIAWLA